MEADKIVPYAPVLIKLLQGVLQYDDNPHWDTLLKYRTPVEDYFARMGLALHLNEIDGFAFLVQPEIIPDPETPRINLPRLTRRVRLSYDATLLCVLLVERLLQFETSGAASSRLVLTVEQIREMIRVFFQERSDEIRLIRNLDKIIGDVEGLGFLKRLRGAEDAYEVRPVLKAKVPADKLAEIKEKLQTYADANS